ncbi:hypothetical protein [Sphingopyxis sp. BSNA05]|uniref:hypothetical protein n=1 Tax=Sphingopyxis sp. BSNA05 TaxID=1236614 RepID=UPI00349F9970
MEALEAAAGEVSKDEIMKLFQAQRDAFHAELPVSYEARMDRINRTAKMIIENQDALCQAVSNDFGHRSSVQTVMTDLMSVVGHAKDHKKNLKNGCGQRSARWISRSVCWVPAVRWNISPRALSVLSRHGTSRSTLLLIRLSVPLVPATG